MDLIYPDPPNRCAVQCIVGGPRANAESWKGYYGLVVTRSDKVKGCLHVVRNLIKSTKFLSSEVAKILPFTTADLSQLFS